MPYASVIQSQPVCGTLSQQLQTAELVQAEGTVMPTFTGAHTLARPLMSIYTSLSLDSPSDPLRWVFKALVASLLSKYRKGSLGTRPGHTAGL